MSIFKFFCLLLSLLQLRGVIDKNNSIHYGDIENMQSREIPGVHNKTGCHSLVNQGVANPPSYLSGCPRHYSRVRSAPRDWGSIRDRQLCCGASVCGINIQNILQKSIGRMFLKLFCYSPQIVPITYAWRHFDDVKTDIRRKIMSNLLKVLGVHNKTGWHQD